MSNKIKRFHHIAVIHRIASLYPKQTHKGTDLHPRVVEIGVNRAFLSTSILEYFPKAYLTLIDPWEPYNAVGLLKKRTNWEPIYQEVCEKVKDYPNVEIKRLKSEQAVKEMDTVDLVFIDGNHAFEEVVKDIQNWKPKIRQGGILGGHDANYKEVKDALQHCNLPHVLDYGNTWWYE